MEPLHDQLYPAVKPPKLFGVTMLLHGAGPQEGASHRNFSGSIYGCPVVFRYSHGGGGYTADVYVPKKEQTFRLVGLTIDACAEKVEKWFAESRSVPMPWSAKAEFSFRLEWIFKRREVARREALALERAFENEIHELHCCAVDNGVVTPSGT